MSNKKSVSGIFVKGGVYSPDSMGMIDSDIFTEYFNDDEEQFSQHFGEYEYGSARCIKSFKITITTEIKHCEMVDICLIK